MSDIELNTKHLGCFGNLSKRSKVNAIVIHHTCTKTPEKTRSALLKKGYSTHFEVDTDGTIYHYADVMRICSHCGSSNCYTIGIDVTHMEDAKFPEVQVAAVVRLVDWLCEKYNLSHEVQEKLKGILPHSALCNTKCPNGFPLDRLNIPDPPKVEEDFDCISRLRDVMRICLVDGKKKEAQELAKQLLGL